MQRRRQLDIRHPSQRAGPYRRGAGQRGFTLVEMLSAIVIVGLLSTMSILHYQTMAESSRVQQGILAILDLQSEIEEYAMETGGLPSYLCEIGQSGLIDPWGNSYQYLVLRKTTLGQARADKFLAPINSDFDLYSMGKNGVSAKQITNASSLDDLIRANDGSYVGLAANY